MDIHENTFFDKLNQYINDENELIRLTEEYKSKYGLFNLINILKKNKFNFYCYGSNNISDNIFNNIPNMMDYEIELFAKIETFLKNNEDESMRFYLKEYEDKYGKKWLVDKLLLLDEMKTDYEKSFSILTYIGSEDQFMQNFADKYNNYCDNLNSETTYQWFLDMYDFIIETLPLYIPYISSAKKIYLEMKKLDKNNLTHQDFDSIYDVTG